MVEGSFGRTRVRRGSWADVVVAGLAVGAVVLLLVPLPTWLLDVFLAANLAMSLLLLLVALQVDSPLRVAAFPTWVVLSTLVRLALNVSSTRLILMQADAGRVIRAYGELVAGASLIVGAVLFLLITIVQFIVIARGAERVAEVGARFVLDGLPGKQMAIDAELRAGTLDARGAEKVRQRLAQESQFFGAMDGAMKFVKGDVIASLLVIAVNLLGGFGIGMSQDRLDAVTALERYGLLTIGDGLAVQIPALLVATAAGVLVTRVAGETRGGIGPELASQLLRHPRVLRWVAGACLLVALVPKMPAWPFFAVALVCGFASTLRPGSAAGPSDGLGGPLAFTVAPDLRALVPGALALQASSLERAAGRLSKTVLVPLGLPRLLTEGQVSLSVDPLLPPGTLELWIHGATSQRVRAPRASSPTEQAAAIAEELTPFLRAHAAELLGVDEVHEWLDEAARRAPARVREAVPAKVPLATFTEALRILLREQVPLTQLDAILEAIAHPAAALADKADAQQVAALARRASRAALSRAVAQGGSRVSFLRFDGLIEDTVREAVHDSGQRRALALAPAAARDILAALRHTLQAVEPASHTGEAGAAAADRRRPVLLAPLPLRPFVRQLVEEDFPELRVVSAEELAPSLELDQLATVSLTAHGSSPRADLAPA